jgi:hypothetical protein
MAEDSNGKVPAAVPEVEAGLRFIHLMEVQGRMESRALAVETSALIDLLIAKGVISARELDDRKRLAETQEMQRDASRILPMIGPMIDKYSVVSPEISCAENLAVCRGACCNLTFHLSPQDLDEGVVRWDYSHPYRIRQRLDDKKCCHFNGSCSVYDKRPAPCRLFDCRNDKRIWADYEKRIPSPELAALAP